MTSMGGCSVIASSRGMFYYKYYPVVGKCKGTVHQETIVGALQYAVRKLEGDYWCNIYLFDVDHYGTWHGQIMIERSVFVYTAPPKAAVYKGYYSEGCDGLQPPYSCSSKEEGQ